MTDPVNSLTPQDAFFTLRRLGLITEAQYQAALKHPEIPELQEIASDLPRILYWMVARNIMQEEELQFVAEGVTAESASPESAEKLRITEGAMELLFSLKLHLNGEFLKTLLEERLITQEQYAKAEPELPCDSVFGSAGALLAWMVMNDFISVEERLAMRESVTADRAFTTAQNRVAIHDEAAALLDKMTEMIHREAKKAVWQAIFPGPRWAWIAGFMVLIGGYAWYLAAPMTVPACDSREVVRTVDGMLFRARIDAKTDYLRGGHKLPDDLASLRNPREVGYAKVENIRGCAGTIEYAASKMPYAYTIKLAADDKSRFIVAGASPEIVEVRFANIDEKGNYSSHAEPVGRANLETALRTGAEDIQKRMPGFTEMKRMQERMLMRSGSRLLDIDPDREREIAEVEPLAPCRELDAGKRYACNVVFERNDRLLAAIGRNGLTIVKGEFTVERAAAGGWQVTPDFSDEYAKAIAQSRIKMITDAAKGE